MLVSRVTTVNDIEEIVTTATNNFTNILSTYDIKSKYPELFWGGNGVGDRWANKRFNYSVIKSNKSTSLYSENEDDTIPEQLLAAFLENNKGNGIIGIYVHSKRTNIEKRPIEYNIKKEIANKSCVVCGTKTSIVCDHKNDLYNDERILNIKLQSITDFQSLCNHCNLQKRQVCRDEFKDGKIYSAKNIERYKQYPFEFPWEKKVFDKNDIYCKNDTYWFDPVEFNRKIYCYLSYVIPLINEIKHKVKQNKLKLIL